MTRTAAIAAREGGACVSIFGRKRRAADADNARLIERIDGRAIKYVARRGLDESGSPVEHIIGRQGRINTQNGQIVIVCNGSEAFRCPVEGAQCGELLSLDGVVIRWQGEGGAEDTVVAYYQYYR